MFVSVTLHHSGFVCLVNPAFVVAVRPDGDMPEIATLVQLSAGGAIRIDEPFDSFVTRLYDHSKAQEPPDPELTIPEEWLEEQQGGES